MIPVFLKSLLKEMTPQISHLTMRKLFILQEDQGNKMPGRKKRQITKLGGRIDMKNVEKTIQHSRGEHWRGRKWTVKKEASARKAQVEFEDDMDFEMDNSDRLQEVMAQIAAFSGLCED